MSRIVVLGTGKKQFSERATVAAVAGTILLLVTAGALAQGNPTATPSGRWRSVDTSLGGIGSMLTFEKDGVESAYRLDGPPMVDLSRKSSPDAALTFTSEGRSIRYTRY